MATDLEKLVVQLSADIRSFDKELARMNGVSNRQFAAVERRARQMNKNLDGIFAKSFRGLAAPLTGVGAALGAAELIRLTDVWTDLNSRVALAAGGLDAGANAMSRLSDVARRTYSSLEQTVESYINNAQALKELGYSTNQQLDYTESLNNALVISAAKGQRAEAVQTALAKAMAGGKLQGINLNTVIEQGGRVALALADGLGVGVNQLRRLGAEGKLTASVVFKALTSQMEKLRTEAAAMPATISDGVQLLKNALLEYVGDADHATEVSARISEALVIMADNFDKTADVALQLAAVIAGALIGRSLLKMISTLGLAGTALVNFTRALAAARTMGGLAASIGGLGAIAGPVGMVIGGAVVASLVAFRDTSSDAAVAARTYADALAEVERKANAAADAIDGATKAIDEETKNKLTLGIEEGKKKIEEAKQAALDLFEALYANVGRDAIPADQLQQLDDLRDRLQKGEISADDAKQALYRLASSNPNFQAVADTFAPLLNALSNAIAAVDLLKGKLGSVGSAPSWADSERKSMSALADMEATNRAFIDSQTKSNALSKEQLAIETEIAKVRKDAADAGAVLTEKQIRDMAAANVAANERRSNEGKKTPAPKKTADDRFDNLTQSIYDRIATMKVEQQTLGATFYEQQKRATALDLEQEALRQVREEARKKGDQDWQNAQLSPDQVRAIDEVSDAYARQADELRKAQEAQELQRDVLKGVFSDFRSALDDGKLDWQDFANIAMNALDKIIDKIENDLIDAILSANSAGGGGSLLGGLFGLLGGGSSGGGIPWSQDIFRAGGGPVKAGQPYIVGEKRPELFVPNTSGTILPQVPTMPKLAAPAASTVSVSPVIHVDARGAAPGVGPEIEAAVKRATANMTPAVVKALREIKIKGIPV